MENRKQWFDIDNLPVLAFDHRTIIHELFEFLEDVIYNDLFFKYSPEGIPMDALSKLTTDILQLKELERPPIDDANFIITEAKQRLAEMKYEHSRMQEVLGEDRDLHSIQLQRNMLATFNSMLVSSLEPLTSTLTDRQQEILNESGYSDLMRNSNSIINCAMLLSLGYIREATTYAESCGGGGSPGSGWGRDKDEDDNHWWRRCIAVSAAMMRPAKYRLRRGR